MSNIKAKKLLEEAAQILEEKQLAEGAFFRDEEGLIIGSHTGTGEAPCVCAGGAIILAAMRRGHSFYVARHLVQTCEIYYKTFSQGKKVPPSIAEYNDVHTKPTVLTMLRSLAEIAGDSRISL